jgi:hypothetical protein
MDTLQERRQLNFEIEKAYIQTSICVKDILKYRQTERGISDIDLYDMFFDSFAYLIILTSDLPQLREYTDKVKPAVDWISMKVNIDKEKDIMARCESGIKVFLEYKKLISDQGIIFLPAR